MPGITLNCRRTSSIILFAALPTDDIVSELNKNGSIAPIKMPTMTFGIVKSIEVNPAALTKALNRAKLVSAADPMANPFPMAAVVFPTLSSLSVISRTLGSIPHISAIPPALSAIGPYASMAMVIPVVASIPTALRAMP